MADFGSARDGGDFGHWSSPPPRFHLDGPAAASSGDLWHQIGNDRLTATAHVRGNVVLYSTAAGLVQLNGNDPDHAERLGGRWCWSDAGGAVIADSSTPCQAVWEVGGASWSARGDGWELHRRVWAPFGDAEVLRVDVELTTRDPQLRCGSFSEMWGFAPTPIVLGGLMSHLVAAPRDYDLGKKAGWYLSFGLANLSRLATDQLRRVLGAQLRLDPTTPPAGLSGCAVLRTRREPKWLATGDPSPLAAIPGTVFLASLSAGSRAAVRGRGSVTMASLTTRLPDAGRTQISYVVGMAAENRIAESLRRERGRPPEVEEQKWSGIWDLAGAGALGRESSWHAGMLRGSQAADAVFGSSYVAQGSAYGFIHGLQGAPRDYAHFMIPLCFADPSGARSMFMTMLALQDRDGSLKYAHTGAGWATSAGAHRAPTDLPIALLWAASEYAWTTGDLGIIDEPAPWRRTRLGSASRGIPTVLDRLVLSWRFLHDRVGLGPHGLIRIGSGDWNDPISAMAPSRRALRSRGESVYNSAFACYVLPRAAALLESRDPDVAAQMTAWVGGLRAELENAWTGRWYSRAWDGTGGMIGEDRLFLDANAWCLIAQVGDHEQRMRLITEIDRRLDAPSPIGATCLDRPIDTRGGILAPGWDTNGGVWSALNALLTWGYALHDPPKALRCLEKQLLAAHARAHPDIWFGIWSGPDAYNAYFGERPGETYVQPATPMIDFPVMNANAHAGPLLALIKVLGLESTPIGVQQLRRSPLHGWTLTTDLARFEDQWPEA